MIKETLLKVYVDKLYGKFSCWSTNVKTDEINRNFIVFDRGDSVAVLLVNDVGTHGLFVEQFRYPAYLNGGKMSLFEVVAGTVEPGREKSEVAVAEVMEETGVKVEELEYIFSFYSSPGASTERVHLYFGVYDKKVFDEAGLEEHGEKTKVKEVPLRDVVDKCLQGHIEDAKTIIIVLTYLLTRDILK